MEIKICSRCKRELTTDKFSKHKRTHDGLNCYCKECKSKISKIFRESNKEKINEGKRKYYGNNTQKVKDSNKRYIETHTDKVKEGQRKYKENNKKEILEGQRKYREENVEKLKEGQRKYRENNKEKRSLAYMNWCKSNESKKREGQEKYYKEHSDEILEYQKKYAKENLEKYCIRNQKRKARKLLLPSTFTIKQWENVKVYFNNKCCYCDRELPLEQEHFISVTSGGGYVESNMICACKTCNCSKHNTVFEDWYPRYKFYSKEREEKILEYLNSVKEEQLTSAI